MEHCGKKKQTQKKFSFSLTLKRIKQENKYKK